VNHPAASPNQKRLDAIRSRLELASKAWGINADDQGTHLLAGEGGDEVIAIVPTAANLDDRELVLRAPDDLRWMTERYGKLAERLRAAEHALANLQPRQSEPKNYATECAMKCQEPAFRVFLEERHGLTKPLNDDRVATRVRSILNIGSRSDLNTDRAAAARWRDLVKSFDAWRRR
jgi:thiamine kinase-like enzyme